MIRLLLIPFLLIGIGCSSEDSTTTIIVDNAVFTPRFQQSFITINEDEDLEVLINFNQKVEESGFLEIEISGNALLSEDFTIDVAVDENNTFSLPVVSGDSALSFSITALIDDDTDTEQIKFNFSNASGFIKLDRNNELQINISDPSSTPTTEETFTAVTWNLEQFPLVGSTTINRVVDLINSMDADVIAFQEIDDIPSFEQLDNLLSEWEGDYFDVRGGIELAYLFKTSEITSYSTLSVIYADDREAFPRQPVLTTVTHVSGLEVTLINIHLKCCDDDDSPARRADASNKLQTYIDSNLSSANVIVLGDFNDELGSGSPFSNFLNDDENYYFADFPIAEGPSAFWSYPSFGPEGSHIDHILITNELVDNLISSETLVFEGINYSTTVSDHRPVSATFSND
ncbi:MAG: endonuclease/exonuclease/phosphatase family protein [Fulvivirga sp.]|uniref:endonuclease/exonuclease/phosphatase family protein n=1 Tax=Fulvivirga sp. TaxID=1931237 RepID=UPI0032ED5F24